MSKKNAESVFTKELSEDFEDNMEDVEELLPNDDVNKHEKYKESQENRPDRVDSKAITDIEEEDADKEYRYKPDESDNVIKEVMNTLFDSRDLGKKTELTDKQIDTMSKGLVLAEIVNVPPLEKYIIKIMELSLSKNRESRKELVKLAQTYRGDMLGYGGESQGAGMFSSIFGR